MNWKKLINSLGGWGGITLILFIFFFGSYFTVKWEVNEHLENRTNQETGLQEQSVMLYYARTDPVPIRNIGENNFNHFGFEQVLFMTAFAIGALLLSNMKDTSFNLKTADEHKAVLDKYLKGNTEIKRYHIFHQTHLQNCQIDDNKPLPFRREIFVEVEFRDSEVTDEQGWKYFAYTFDPYSDGIKDIIELNDLPNSQMKCPNCGSSPDFKVRTPDGLRELRKKWKDEK